VPERKTLQGSSGGGIIKEELCHLERSDLLKQANNQRKEAFTLKVLPA